VNPEGWRSEMGPCGAISIPDAGQAARAARPGRSLRRFASRESSSAGCLCLALLVLLSTVGGPAIGWAGTNAPAAIPAVAEAPPPPTASIEALTLVPSAADPYALHRERGAPSVDESLAAAVEGGSDASLERPDPFRKRSFDLFRTEREVEIGDREMRVRLRVRPKTRETVSVELRF